MQLDGVPAVSRFQSREHQISGTSPQGGRVGRALFISDPMCMLKGTLLKALSSPGEEQKQWGHQQQDGAVL